VAAAVLHADRGPGSGNIHHPAGSCAVCNLVVYLKILKWHAKEKLAPPGIAPVADIAEHGAATA
jgi:hypothetical protein